ncbi:MAG TPA: hypothetical protein PK948_03370 [Gemmatimonadales bacterium]|nr:hypothetical protein [Gemmatimonadales bacterium]
MESTSRRPQGASTHLALTVAGLAGVAAVFLPFAAGVSPLQAVVDSDLWRYAAPFFLAPLIAVATRHWALFGTLGRRESMLAYIVSGASILGTLSMYAKWEYPPDGLQMQLAVALPIAVLIIGGIGLRQMRKGAGSPKEYAPALALQVAYLSNAALCLAGFYGESLFSNGWGVGAWVVIWTCLVYLGQIALARRAG